MHNKLSLTKRNEKKFNKNAEKFAVSKNVRIFAVQYRGIEQLVARRAHNPEAGGSSPPPATTEEKSQGFSFFMHFRNRYNVSA